MCARAPLLPTPPSRPHTALFSSPDSVHCSVVQGLLVVYRKERNPTPPRSAIYQPRAGGVASSEKHERSPCHLLPSLCHQASRAAWWARFRSPSRQQEWLNLPSVARDTRLSLSPSWPSSTSPTAGHPHTSLNSPGGSKRIHLISVWTSACKASPSIAKVEMQGKTHFWVPCMRQRPREGGEVRARPQTRA